MAGLCESLAEAKVLSMGNGLSVLHIHRPQTQLVSIQAWVKSGSMHEGNYVGSGIAHAIEHMVFKGTQKFTAEQLTQHIEQQQAEVNAYTTYDRTVYYIDGASQHAEALLQVVIEMMFCATFPVEEWQKEKQVILREMDMVDDDVHSALFDKIMHLSQQASCLETPIIGYRQLFEQLVVTDLIKHYRQNYTTSNIFFTVVGDMTVDQINAAFQDYGTKLPSALPQNKILPLAKPLLANRIHDCHFATEQVAIARAWTVTANDLTTKIAFDLLVQLFSKGEGALLTEHFCYQKNLCYQIDCDYYQVEQQVGLFLLYVDLDKEKEAAFFIEWQHFLEQLDISFHFTKNWQKLMANYATSLELDVQTIEQQATMLSQSWYDSYSTQLYQQYQQQLQTMTAQDVAAIVSKYLHGSALHSTVIMRPYLTTAEVLTEPRKVVESQPKLQIFANQISMVTSKQDDTNLMTLTYASINSLATTTAATAGYQQMVTNLMARAKNGAYLLASNIEDKGGKITLWQTADFRFLQVVGLVKYAAELTENATRIWQNALFDRASFDLEKATAIADSREIVHEPLEYGLQQLWYQIFGKLGYGLPKLGTEDSLQNMNLEQLQKYYSQSVHADKTTLVITINSNKTAVASKLQEQFGTQFRQYQYQNNIVTSAEKMPVSEQHYTVQKSQAVVAMAYVIAGHNDRKNYLIYTVLNSWLQDMAGPLFQRIREEKALAYYCSSQYYAYQCDGILLFYLGTAVEQLIEAKHALQQLLPQLPTLLTAATWQTAVDKVLLKLKQSNQRAELLAVQQAQQALLYRQAYSLQQTVVELATLSWKEAKNVLATTIKQQPYLTTVSPLR